MDLRVSKKIMILFLLLMACPSMAYARLWPHIKTAGFDYGYPRTVENLEFLASHHDMIIGAGDFQTKKISEFQYDTMKKVNPQVLLIPYTVIQAFTFPAMEEFFVQWATEHGYDPESLYIHYYSDQVVLMRTRGVKTSGTGTPSDRICDKNGNLLADGQSGNYYISLGYGNGGAKTLKEARTYQYWNAGFEARFNHLSEAWQGAYKAYVLDVITVNADKNKYADGIYLDTYMGIVDIDGYLPNMHQLIEVREAGYGADDDSARNFYATAVAEILGEVESYLKNQTGKQNIFMITNGGDIGYAHDKYKFAVVDHFGPGKIKGCSLEYLTAPSKSQDWTVESYFKPHFESYDQAVWMDQCDTSWYSYGDEIPPLGGKQFMIGSFYLFNHPNAYFAIHYGSPARYGPGLWPNIGEDKGGKYADSHWDKMLEYDIGVPVSRPEPDLWGVPNTNRMYVVEYVKGAWPTPGRYVLARKYSKGMVIVRFEKANNNSAIKEIGTDPREYELGGTYRRLLEDNSLGPPVTRITLGKAEGAIMIDANVGQDVPAAPPLPAPPIKSITGKNVTP